MKNVKPPQFLGNLYRDMRDRHLLLPALALVIGMLAVPILLKSHNDAHKAATASANGGTQSNSAVPAVVTQELGVTKYKQRLERLQSKNPFHQRYTAPPPSAQASASPSATATSGTSSGTSLGSSSGSTSSTGSLPPVSTSTSPGSTSSSVSPPAGSSSGGSQSVAPHHHTTPGVRYYAWRASVKVGEAGDLKARPEVQRLALLPSDSKPVVSFLGATEDGSKAVFLVSPDVDSVTGDGRCLPSHSACQYMVMKPGDKANFHYAPNNTRYNLVLVDVHPVDVTDKLPKKSHGKAQPQQKLPLLGDG